MTLTQASDIIKRKKWTILLLAVLTPVIGLSMNTLRTPTYKSQAILMVGQGQLSPSIGYWEEVQASQSIAMGYSEIMTSPFMLRKVQEKLTDTTEFRSSLGELKDAVIVEPIAGAPILKVSASDKNPLKAQKIASTFAGTFVDYANSFYEESLQGAEKSFEESQRQLEAAKALGNLEKIAAAEIKREKLAEEYERLVARAASGAKVRVIAPAQIPKSPGGPGSLLIGFVTLLLGTMGGFAFAFFSDSLDSTIKTADEARELLSLPVLGTVPRLKRSMSADPSFTDNSYRVLQMNFRQLDPYKALKSLLITDVEVPKSKVAIALSLGQDAVQAGRDTVVIDADLHMPSLHSIFQIENTPGLSDLLLNGKRVLEEKPLTLNQTKKGLKLLCSGTMPSDPLELLTSYKMTSFVKKIKELTDLVLFSGPSVLSAETPALAAGMDGVLLVISARRTTREAAIRAKERLQNAKANIIGIVVSEAR